MAKGKVATAKEIKKIIKKKQTHESKKNKQKSST